MRLFFALWPDAPVQRALGEWARACHDVCGGRRIPVEKLHVTLAFLGEVDDECYRVLTAIAGAAAAPAFDLCFERVAYFRHNRIVYAAADAIPAALATLVCTLTEGVVRAGLPVERRPFLPHVTLLRDAKRAPVHVAVDALKWRVGAVTLVETLRGEGKHAYRVRESWTLAG